MENTPQLAHGSAKLSQAKEHLQFGIGFILLSLAFSAINILATEENRLDGIGFAITILGIGFCIPAVCGHKWANWVLISLLITWVFKAAIMILFFKVGFILMLENTLVTPLIRVLLIALVAQYSTVNPKQGTVMLIVVSLAFILESLWGVGRTAHLHSGQIISSLEPGEKLAIWKLTLLSLWKALSIHFVSLLTKLPLILAILHFVWSMKVKEIPVEKTFITLPRAKLTRFLESVSYLFVSGFGRLEMIEIIELKTGLKEGESKEFTFFPYFEGEFVPLKLVFTTSADVAFYAPQNLLQRIKQKRLILK
jgi:hypothetical protein